MNRVLCSRNTVFALASWLLMTGTMKRLAGAFALTVLATACGVGDPGTGDDGPGSGSNATGRVCGAVLSTTGTFAPDTAHPQPVENMGCWPYGTWTFTAKVEMNDCQKQPPTLLPQYQMRVDYSLNADGDPVQSYTFTTDPSARHLVKVSQGGAGLCEGELQIFSADGKTVYLLKPELYGDGSLLGDGEYGVFNDDQWPL